VDKLEEIKEIADEASAMGEQNKTGSLRPKVERTQGDLR